MVSLLESLIRNKKSHVLVKKIKLYEKVSENNVPNLNLSVLMAAVGLGPESFSDLRGI